MLKKIEAKLKTVWIVLRSKSVHVTFQTQPGQACKTIGFGQGDLRDMVLYSKEIKKNYEDFLEMINHMAAEAGELHKLQELKDATEVLNDGRN